LTPRTNRVGPRILLVMVVFASAAHAQVQQFRQRTPEETKRDSRKLDNLYRISRLYLSVGTGLDGFSTARGLNHPTIAHRTDQSVLGYFYGTEVGWAGSVVGKRNTSAVVAANVLLNFGVERLSRTLYRKGGRWRLLAIGLCLWKATDSTVAGVGNFRFNAGIDARLRTATGYQGKIIWSH